MAAPALGTNPAAVLLNGREARCGSAFAVRFSKRIESNPPQTYGEKPSAAPANIRLAPPRRMCSAANKMASAPVAHALLLLVTSPPSAKRDDVMALTPLFIMRSTPVLPIRL